MLSVFYFVSFFFDIVYLMYCILHCILLSCCKSIHIVGFMVTRDLLVIVQIVRLTGNVRKKGNGSRTHFSLLDIT